MSVSAVIGLDIIFTVDTHSFYGVFICFYVSVHWLIYRLHSTLFSAERMTSFRVWYVIRVSTNRSSARTDGDRTPAWPSLRFGTHRPPYKTTTWENPNDADMWGVFQHVCLAEWLTIIRADLSVLQLIRSVKQILQTYITEREGMQRDETCVLHGARYMDVVIISWKTEVCVKYKRWLSAISHSSLISNNYGIDVYV